MEEFDLVSKAQKGDFQAFEELVLIYKKRVFSFAYYHVRNKADAEDISQEVFWRLFNYIKKYDVKRKFFSWIYAIEMNVIKSFFQKNKNRTVELTENFINSIIFNDNSLLSVDDKLFLFKAMEEISEDEKNILFLKYMDDLSIKEISETLEITEENVKVRIYRAKEKLQKIIGGQNE